MPEWRLKPTVQPTRKRWSDASRPMRDFPSAATIAASSEPHKRRWCGTSKHLHGTLAVSASRINNSAIASVIQQIIASYRLGPPDLYEPSSWPGCVCWQKAICRRRRSFRSAVRLSAHKAFIFFVGFNQFPFARSFFLVGILFPFRGIEADIAAPAVIDSFSLALV